LRVKSGQSSYLDIDLEKFCVASVFHDGQVLEQSALKENPELLQVKDKIENIIERAIVASQPTDCHKHKKE